MNLRTLFVVWCAAATVACSGSATAQETRPAQDVHVQDAAEEAAPRGLTGPPVGRPLTVAVEDVTEAIAATLAEPEADVDRDVAAFYGSREYRPAWLDERGRRSAATLLSRAVAADEDGLCPLIYDAEDLHARLASRHERLESGESAAALDVALTRTFVRLVVHLALGWEATGDASSSARRIDPVEWLEDVRRTGALDALEAVVPQHPEYAALHRALHRYQDIERRGGWPAVPGDLFLRPGAGPDPEVLEALRLRLWLTGDLDSLEDETRRDETREAGDPLEASTADGENDATGDPDGTAGTAAPAVYDEATVEAVRRFQGRHGLQVDGIIGPQTVGALNVPVQERIGQIALNMDRWRRLPDDLGALHVRVNIPDYTLTVVEDGRERLAMRTVVGRTDRQTPVFSDRIRYLEFRPYWNVPDSIVERDILPHVQEDPTYLERNRYDVLEDWGGPPASIDLETFDWEAETFEYRLQQRPGPHNALGLVKFMFPNRYAVYLHDTPSPEGFDRRVRTFSSGCVRVERPVELARVLLRNLEGWTAERIESAMNGSERQEVPLSEAVPVHLMYMTAWAGESGNVEFRPDVYGRDAAAIERIRCRVEEP